MRSYDFRVLVLVMLGVLAWQGIAVAGIDRDQAMQNVKQLICKNNMTVDASLEQAIKAHSQRDIGWQVFEESGYFDVQRSVLVSKGVELRYRWRIYEDGKIQPENERAEKLCLADSD